MPDYLRRYCRILSPSNTTEGSNSGAFSICSRSFRPQYLKMRLMDEISEEVCGEGGLPVLMRMAIQNCQGLVLAQRAPLDRRRAVPRTLVEPLFPEYRVGARHAMGQPQGIA